ncbi:MAG: lipase family protein [Promethearchaeota archaeon]
MEETKLIRKTIPFIPAKKEFINKIKLSVKACSEAYDDKFNENKYEKGVYPGYPNQDLPITEVKWFGKSEKKMTGDIQGFTALLDRTLLIVFRGTSKVLFESLTNIWPFKRIKAFKQTERKNNINTRKNLLKDKNVKTRTDILINQIIKWDRRRLEEKDFLKISPMQKEVEALIQINPNASIEEIINKLKVRERKVTRAINAHIKKKFTDYVAQHVDDIDQQAYDTLLNRKDIQKIVNTFNVNKREGWNEHKIIDLMHDYHLERLKKDNKIKEEFNKELNKIIKRSTVHSAYWRKYESQARDQIHKRIKNTSDSFDDIIITGHSYGGALSILCSWDIWKSFIYQEADKKKLKSALPLYCIPFANLRPGSKRFAKLLNLCVPEIHRFIYGNDGFAKLLPPLFGFRNPGILYHIGPKKRKRRIRNRLIHHSIKTRYVPAIIDPEFDIKRDADKVNWDWEAMSVIKLYR